MCRLFGLHTGMNPVSATFWLLDAPDSLREQSHREPDGAGIGVFDQQGRPVIDKQPMAAWEDSEFAREARVARSRTFVAHVRYASTGAHTEQNTHPFAQDGRLFAHNGAFADLETIDSRLLDLEVQNLVGGQTDSERMFALITGEARRRDGDVAAAIAAAVTSPERLGEVRGFVREWCPRSDSNRHVSQRQNLNLVRLPISPPGQGALKVSSARRGCAF